MYAEAGEGIYLTSAPEARDLLYNRLKGQLESSDLGSHGSRLSNRKCSAVSLQRQRIPIL